MKLARRLFHVYWPLLLAILIEALAILVASVVSSSFESSTLSVQDCHATPNQFPTNILTILGIIIAIIGVVRVFKKAKRWPHIVSSIVLLLLVISGALIAGLVLNFLAGWCF